MSVCSGRSPLAPRWAMTSGWDLRWARLGVAAAARAVAARVRRVIMPASLALFCGVQATQHERVDIEVAGDDGAGGQDRVAAVGVGHPAAGFLHKQDPRRQVPGVEVALPVAVEA